MVGRNQRHIAISLFVALMALALAALVFSTASANGASGPVALPTMPPTPTGADNQKCLGCHSNPAQQMKAANGEIISLYVDPDALKSSVHGAKNVACVQCHSNLSGYPHRSTNRPTGGR